MAIYEHNKDKTKINSISDYLKIIDEKIETLKRINNNAIFCYRGEDRTQGTKGEIYVHSMPNIFRPKNFDKFTEYKWFEKSMLDEVKSNNLSNSIDYLEVAMDAQHGGFPSRLLDITFNSLIALFFAVTPHYTKEINENDKADGRVIVYAADKLTTSKTETVKKIYEELVNEKKYNCRLDSHFHFLIDFVELNSRIKAQQGGFILFGGNQFIPVPRWKFEEIIIPQESKEKLRQQLDLYFGINMGMIYPEPDNKVDYIITRALKVKNEIDYYAVIKEEMEFKIDNYINYINYINYNSKRDESEINQLLKELACYIYDIAISLNDLAKSSKDENKKAIMLTIGKMINDKIGYINEEFHSSIEGNLLDPDIVNITDK